MTSLRNRIAISCTILLISTVTVISLVEALAFRHFLFNVRSTLNQKIAGEIRMYIAEKGVPPSLDRWGSTVTFIQLDELLPGGKTVTVKRSSELGLNLLTSHVADVQKKPLLMLEQPAAFHARNFVLRIGADLSYINSVLAETQIFVVFVTLFAIPIVVFISITLSSSAIRPIENLILTMKHMDSEKLERRMGFDERTDEIGELARSFDEMLARLRASFERERRFIADASHELKTPLTVIHSNAQMLLRWAQNDEVVRTESIAAIITESKSLGMLIEELLLLARMDSGDYVVHESVDLAQLCADLVSSYQPRIGARRLSLTLEAYDEAEQLWVFGNATLLRRVFSNLLDNALKFTHEGEIVVTLARLEKEVEATVSDTGLGVPEAELERIFERLYRTDRSRTRQTEGFGLGLSIAQAFVHAHHGTIKARQRNGGGTSIGVRLPVSLLTQATC